MKQLRVGIIGQGRSGWNIHGQTLTERLQDYFTVAAVCDHIPERCNEAKAATGCAVYVDHEKMLAETPLDLVVNVTRSNDHERINLELLAKGFHVLSDKPLARTVAAFDQQIAAAKKANRHLLAFQQSRFAPGFMKIREIIATGVLGRIVMVKIAFNSFSRRWDWQTLHEYLAGNLLNTGPHPVDQALQFYGDGALDPEQVICIMDRTDNTFGNAEDHVKLLLAGTGQPTVDVEISSCDAFAPYQYQVYGTRGGLAGNYSKLNWKYYRPEEASPRSLITDPMPERKYCTETLPWYQEQWEGSAEATNFFTWTKSLYMNLYQVLTENAVPIVQLEQVRRQIAIMEECHRQNQHLFAKQTASIS